MTETSIVFFDGVCGLCNHFVDWLIEHDHEKRFRFAPLQGETARQKLFSGVTPSRLDSMVLWQQDVALHKSDAVIGCAHELTGPWHLLVFLRWVPRVIRDGIYDLLATNRYQLFGRRDVCRVPTTEEKSLFLP
jgi:predicted DCC family thiol-disulfide oxidoreductase YuxK